VNATISETVTGRIQAEIDQVQQSATVMLTLAGQLKARVANFKMGKGQSVALAEIVYHADPLVIKKE